MALRENDRRQGVEELEIQSWCPYSSDVVAEFVHQEAGWRVTTEEMEHILQTDGLQAATIFAKRHPEKLLAIAMAVPTGAPLVSVPVVHNSPVYFLCYVVVARSHRGKGLAHRVVVEVIRQCQEERRSEEMRLLSSRMGFPLYKQLGFVQMEQWDVHYMTRPLLLAPASRGRAKVASPAQEEAAKDFEASELCSDRKSQSRLNVEQGALCVVIESELNSKIVAAVWVRAALQCKRTNKRGIWLAPVVAESADLAKEVITGAIAIWEERNSSLAGYDVRSLVLSSGGHGSSVAIFESLGFRKTLSPPFMRKVFSGTPTSLPAPSVCQYALTGWHGT